MVCALALIAFSSAFQRQTLLGADEVLRRLKELEAKAASNSNRFGGNDTLPPALQRQNEVRKAVNEFQASMRTLSPNEAAARWLALFDATLRTGSSFNEVVAAMPPTPAWPTISSGIESRVGKKQTIRAAALRAFGALLGSDTTLQQRAAANAMSIALKMPAQARTSAVHQMNELELDLAIRAHDVQTIKAAMHRKVADPGSEVYLQDHMLAALGSEQEAFLEELFRTAKSPLTYSGYYADSASGRMIYRLALKTAPQHKAPHWGIAERMDNQALYEAISKRFNPFKTWPPFKGKQPARYTDSYADRKTGLFARTDYILTLAKSGQIEPALKAAGDGSSLAVDYPFEASVHADRNIHSFLARLLTAHPKSNLWKQHESMSLDLGEEHGLLDATTVALKSPGLNDAQRVRILHARETAFLALDRVNDALDVMRKRYAIESKHPNSSSSDDAFPRMQELAKLLGRADLQKELDEQRAKGKYAMDGSGFRSKDLVKRESDLLRPDEVYSNPFQPIGIELMKIYAQANRPQDVIKIAEAEGIWAQDDISKVPEPIFEGDSQESPALILAQSLLKVGRKEEAYRIAKWNVLRKLDSDAAYELLLKCNYPTLLTDLDELAALNQFEERPLIWKAKALLDAGNLSEAESTIKAAIAIDPSDGDQPHGRRMYGYAVYAEILDRKGEADQAAFYRNVVRAIRLAENADDYLQAGLRSRAIQIYNQALSVFSDAYCIQSRLAVNLAQSGRMPEAVSHYRRAYELMVDSFGLVETHCFGCEEAFMGETQQAIAEEVFNKIEQERPNKPQVHYLLGYLRETQHRDAEAIVHYKRAVELDPRYLNAWKHLAAVGKARLPGAELKQIEERIAQLEPKDPVGYRGSNWINWASMSFSEAYETAAKQQGPPDQPVFRLKPKPLRPHMVSDMENWQGDLMMDVPKTPGAAILRTSLYLRLQWLLDSGSSMG